MAPPGQRPELLIGGKYRVLGLLGRGSMGAVYEAVNESIGRRVALKVLEQRLVDNPEFLRRFELEARAAAIINHAGMVEVLDTGQMPDGAPFIVMEYLQGATLRQVQRKLGKLGPGQASAVLCPVLETLAAAHAAGVVHRDLKPANIYLALRPTMGVKVLDFGISKFRLPQQKALTMAGKSLGTPHYMAPEQLRDGSTVGPVADLYSVGAVLYDALLGRPPFESDSAMVLELMVLERPHLPLVEAAPELPPLLSELVDRLLDKDPSARPRSAQAVLELLMAAARPRPVSVFAVVGLLAGAPRPSSLDALPKPEASTLVNQEAVPVSQTIVTGPPLITAPEAKTVMMAPANVSESVARTMMSPAHSAAESAPHAMMTAPLRAVPTLPATVVLGQAAQPEDPQRALMTPPAAPARARGPEPVSQTLVLASPLAPRPERKLVAPRKRPVWPWLVGLALVGCLALLWAATGLRQRAKVQVLPQIEPAVEQPRPSPAPAPVPAPAPEPKPALLPELDTDGRPAAPVAEPAPPPRPAPNPAPPERKAAPKTKKKKGAEIKEDPY